MYETYLEQLNEAGKIRNLKEHSITCYKNDVFYFLNYMNKNPEELTCQDVRAFLLAKKRRPESCNLESVQFLHPLFYRNVLHILWDDITVPRMILDHKLPTVLTAIEIEHLLDAINNLKYKAMFATMYSSGMRVSEVIHLQYDDISRTTMQIHIRDSKNRMDRYTILSKRNLKLLTEYWFEKGRPRGILFPNQFTGNYLTVSSLEQVISKVFRGKYMDELKKLWKDGRLEFHGTAEKYRNHYLFKELLAACYSTNWVPYCKKTFQGAQSVITVFFTWMKKKLLSP